MSLKKAQNLASNAAQNSDIKITSASVYVESESDPLQQNYFFAYKITIKNMSSTTAQLMSRHWVITDALGHIEEVRGPGAVGLQPKITAGQSFEYDSACPLRTSSGTMKGTFQFIDENGGNFDVGIPEFYLIAPLAMH